MIRIFHTADIHIGLKFTRGYPETVQQDLVDARLETLSRMVGMANAQNCGLFVVAGDLFENLQVAKATIREAAKSLRRFEGLVVVMPGNHDYIQETDDPIWPTFVDAVGEGHLLLRKRRPYDLSEFNLNAVLYPGVCTSRHSAENAIGWVKEVVGNEETMGKLRIGVAHGSLDKLSPDFGGDYYPMTRAELDEAGVHLWLLGHTHIRYPEKESGTGDTVFFPSVPEPDGFDCRHGGHAWIIDLGGEGDVTYRSVPTGRYCFHELETHLAGEQDFERLKRNFQKLDATRDLVKLQLTGRLRGDLFDGLASLHKELEKSVLYLKANVSGVLREIRWTDIDREFTEKSFPHRLLAELAESDHDLLALQLAYELIQEARL
jgi:exonuclease SbcD